LAYIFLFWWSVYVFDISVLLSLQMLEMFPPPFLEVEKALTLLFGYLADFSIESFQF
jgi:hypothetical protein